jgi:hydroxymethylpyrimidine pyrophosphatase-like HAD family hydrolase
MMRYHVLAVDYDGTIAQDGRVTAATLEALTRLRNSGRKLILVTGRRLEPLIELLPDLSLFNSIVAENGALVFDPESGREILLAAPPPPEFAAELRRRSVTRMETGRCIVALWQPDQHVALQVIQEIGLELQIIFNKDAVMVLPSGINKAAGLRLALRELGLSSWNAVAVGDAENDEAMLRTCGASAAVANAIDAVKDIADIVLNQPRGSGVEELVEDILATDLRHLEYRTLAARTSTLRAPNPRGIVIGNRLDGTPFTIAEYGESILVTGGPGGGKSKLAISMLERLTPRGVQCCIIDPEGDYEGMESSITLGNAERVPSVEEVLGVLERPGDHCTVSMFSMDAADRPAYFQKLFHGLTELRSRTGRPHWIVVDEAHYAVPQGWQPAEDWGDAKLQGMMFITAYHDRLADALLRHVDWIVSIAEKPETPIRELCKALGEPQPKLEPPEDQQAHQALAWRRGDDKLIWFTRISPQSDARRHSHSHYEGEMDEHLQFVFRGPEANLNLTTENIKQFVHIGGGVDDATWSFHKNANDYSRWIRDVIKDSDVADEIEQIENDQSLSIVDSRSKILETISNRFDPTTPRAEAHT